MAKRMATRGRWERVVRTMALTGLGLLSMLVVGYFAGARFNMTESLPQGLYWRVERPVSRNAYVRFCPPAIGAFAEAMRRGYLHDGRCPSGYRALIKRVSGVTNDAIAVARDAIRVNGIRLPRSAPLTFDVADRPLPHPDQTNYVLTSAQLWVMSDTYGRSFDSRYFGPIDRAWVTEVVIPVLTWGYGGTLSR